MPYTIEIKDVPAQHLAVVRFTAGVAEMAENFGRAFGEVYEYAMQSGAKLEGPAIAYYEQLGNERFDVRAGFVVDKPIEGNGHVIPFDLPAGKVATTMHVGSYEKLQEAYAALMEQAPKQGVAIDMSSPMWEEYLTGPETPPEQQQTIICWPVKEQ